MLTKIQYQAFRYAFLMCTVSDPGSSFCPMRNVLWDSPVTKTIGIYLKLDGKSVGGCVIIKQTVSDASRGPAQKNTKLVHQQCYLL